MLASHTEIAEDDASFHFLLSTPKSLDKVNDDFKSKDYTLLGQFTALAQYITGKADSEHVKHKPGHGISRKRARAAEQSAVPGPRNTGYQHICVIVTRAKS